MIRNVPVDKIDNRTVNEPVDDIADGPANDQSNGDDHTTIFSPTQPDKQPCTNSRGDCNQKPFPRDAPGLEQAETDPLIPDQHKVEKGCYVNRFWRVHEHKQNPPLCRLIEGNDH